MQIGGKCHLNFLTFNVLPQNALVNLDFGFQSPQWCLSPIPYPTSPQKDVYYKTYLWDENQHINDFQKLASQKCQFPLFPQTAMMNMMALITERWQF